MTPLRDVLENHRLEIEEGVTVDDLAGWFKEESGFDTTDYGFQAFSEFLNYAQDKTVVRMEPNEEEGSMTVHLGAEFYPPAVPVAPEPVAVEGEIEEEDEPQPYVEGQPTIFEPNPPPPKAKKAPARKRPAKNAGNTAGGAQRRSRRKKPAGNS
jgi:hypothetical protein